MNNEDKKKYAERVLRFIDVLFLKKFIKRRSWYHDLSRFDLGDNFFEKVFKADKRSAVDKQDFYCRILLPSYKTFAMFHANAKVESGLIIEPSISHAHEKEKHACILGYEWWIRIYNLGCRENQFDAEQKFVLENKRKHFFNELKKN